MDTFAVLGASTVTNTGVSVLSGNLGVAPGTSITGFVGSDGGPGVVDNGTIHDNDGVAQQAATELTAAFNTAAQQSSTGAISSDLAGQDLSPGVYTSPTTASMQLSGQLTLDAHGDPDAVFIFQAGSTLITGSGATVQLLDGAQACNVYWEVGSSATIGAGSAFVGNVMAADSITMNTGATLQGRALAETGAVTLDTNTITAASCSTTTTTGGTTSTTGGTTTPTGGATAGTTGGTTGTTGGTSGKKGSGTATRTQAQKAAAAKAAKRKAARRKAAEQKAARRKAARRRAAKQKAATQKAKAKRRAATLAAKKRAASGPRPPKGHRGGFTG